MFPKFLNFITLIPNNEEISIVPSSKIGWYILYAPNLNQKESEIATPIPIYHDGSGFYNNWTTRIPIGCHGHSNHQVGFCNLIYQNLEDPLSGQNGIGYLSTIDKTLNSCQGRILYPKLPEIPIDDETEYYCFYAKKTICPKFNSKKIPEITPRYLKNNWKLGFITYSDIPSSAIVPTSVFGVPVEGIYRNIGNLDQYFKTHNSYSIVKVISDQLPVIQDLPNQAINFKIKTVIPEIYTFNTPNTIRLLMVNSYFGMLTVNSPDVVIRYLNNDIIELTNCPNELIINISGITWINPPIEIQITAGNTLINIELL